MTFNIKLWYLGYLGKHNRSYIV